MKNGGDSTPFGSKKDVKMGVADSQSGIKKKSSKKSRGTKKGHRQRKSKLTSSDLTKPSELTGDSLQNANVGPATIEPANRHQSQSETMRGDDVDLLLKSQMNKKKASKGKLKSIKARGKRRLVAEKQRSVVDRFLRSAPHRVMSEWYKIQAGPILPLSERLMVQWTPDQISVVEDGSERSLVPHIKRIVGEDYAVPPQLPHEETLSGEPVKRKPAGTACLAIGYDAESAVRIARRVYDKSPVIKLFSRHIDKDQQRKTLRQLPQGFTTTMSGTSKRIHDLVSADALTLNHTKVVVIDLCRNSILSNLLDIPNTSQELFALIHAHMRHLLESGSLHIILVIQTEEEMPKERFPQPTSDEDGMDEDGMDEDVPDFQKKGTEEHEPQ